MDVHDVVLYSSRHLHLVVGCANYLSRIIDFGHMNFEPSSVVVKITAVYL